MLNLIIIVGRLCADPELRYTQSQKPVASFRIAVDRDFDTEKKTDFFSVTAWGKTGEFVSKWFTKGSLIILEGRVQNREWKDKDGNKRTDTEIIADRAYFGESKTRETAPLEEHEPELPF